MSSLSNCLAKSLSADGLLFSSYADKEVYIKKIVNLEQQLELQKQRVEELERERVSHISLIKDLNDEVLCSLLRDRYRIALNFGSDLDVTHGINIYQRTRHSHADNPVTF